MRKQISFLRYFAILFLTVLIFVTGILIGGDVEELRVKELYSQLQQQDLNYQIILAESNYLDYLISSGSMDNESCQQVESLYYTSVAHLEDSRIKLENYINTAKVKEDEYQILKDHYANLQVSYWIIAEKIKSSCQNTSMNTVLYFYGNKKDCPACEDQGVHLTYVKAKLKDDVMMFSFDSKKEGVVALMSSKYDVKYRELPVIVVNDEIYGFSDNDELFSYLNVSLD